ncbi:MAG: ATP phosphoribosyltransferase regulatory subunit [Chloroflexi bacterium]|nr:ATP phosphoribosyltransferase regulatory subunit [Chloroflexota bacterium]
METQRCKGSRDLLPGDMARFRHVEKVFRSCCLGWGYQEVRTPTLEYLHLFTSTGTLTPNMLSRVYSFLDWDGWSGERVVLRPDGTIPAARLYVENFPQAQPAKLFYIENVFSYEETGRESRERWQCGAEVVGSARPLADVELIMLALETLGQLGIKEVKVHLSHAGVIRAVLKELGLSPAQQSELFQRVLDGDTEAMSRMVSASPHLRNAMSLLFEGKGRSAGHLQNLKITLERALLSPHLEASMNDFIAIAQCLTELGCEYQVDIVSGRSFEYYTGIIFRFYSKGERLGGGGRYNDLIPLLGGGDIPASGFALPLDRLINLITDWQDKAPRVLIQSDVSITGIHKLCFETAGALRRAGYVAELDQGHAKTSDYRWVLAIKGESAKPAFLLTDKAGGKSLRADSAAEILKALQTADATKASSP